MLHRVTRLSHCWCLQVDGFLAAVASKSPTTYVEASQWKLVILSTAFKASRSQTRRATATDPASSTAATPDSVVTSPAVERVAVSIWATAADLLQRGLLAPGGAAEEPVRLEAASACQRALQLLGLEASASNVAQVAGLGSSSSGSKSTKKENKDSKSKGKVAGAGDGAAGSSLAGSAAAEAPGAAPRSPDARFQMRYCGHMLPREVPPDRDPRVQSFNPDMWQRKVRPGVCAKPGSG